MLSSSQCRMPLLLFHACHTSDARIRSPPDVGRSSCSCSCCLCCLWHGTRYYFQGKFIELAQREGNPFTITRAEFR